MASSDAPAVVNEIVDRCRAVDQATIDWLVGLDETTRIAGTLYCHARRTRT